MQKCKNCQGILLPGAEFCHKCGYKVSDEKEITEVTMPIQEPDNQEVINENKHVNTQENAKEITSEIIKELPKKAAFSQAKATIDFEIIDNRNQHQEKTETIEKIKNTKAEEKIIHSSTNNIDFTAYKALFFNTLHLRVQDEHDAKQYSEFVEIFYRKKFQDTIIQRYNLLLEDFGDIERKMPLPEKPKERLLTHTIENLVDYFIYTYCKELNDVFPLPLILRYADAKPEQIKSSSFSNDFLQLQDENLLVYRDFISMPQEKLKNAFQSFLFTEREELVYFICDLSITGSGKEGFAISNKRMYWRMPLGKSHSVSFDNIQHIKHEKEWLEINGLFFNINKSLNMKVLRMFKKIKLICK
jgi:hypothetical protein